MQRSVNYGFKCGTICSALSAEKVRVRERVSESVNDEFMPDAAIGHNSYLYCVLAVSSQHLHSHIRRTGGRNSRRSAKTSKNRSVKKVTGETWR